MQGSILRVTIPPPAHSRGFAIFFLLGGLFRTPGHTERDNSPAPGLLMNPKYAILCKNGHKILISNNSKHTRFAKNVNTFLEVLNKGYYLFTVI